MTSRKFSMYHPLFIGICLLLFSVGSIYGQQQSDTQADVQPLSENALKIKGEFVIERLKDKTPAEKLSEIESKLEDKEFTDQGLAIVLRELGIADEEVKIMITKVKAHLAHIETLKKVGPNALSIHKLNENLKKKQKELDTASAEEVKKEISKKVEELNEQKEDIQEKLLDAAIDINENQIRKLPENLLEAGFSTEESEIISGLVLEQSEFIKKYKTLKVIAESIEDIQKDIAEKEKEKEKAETDEQKAILEEQLKNMSKRLKALEQNYNLIIAGIDMDTLLEKEKKKVDWEEELKEIFSPIIVELKEITDRPRKIERLRSEVSYYNNHLPQITQAVANIRKMKSKLRKGLLLERLKASDEFWTQQETEFKTKLESVQHQLFELEKRKMTFSEFVEYFTKSVLKHRGKNIIVALLAFVATFFVFHLLRILIMKINPFKFHPKFQFIANIIDVLLYMATFFAAATAMIIVLYSYGDWLVLGIILIIFLGIVWTAKDMLPIFAEQIKLLLGFGPVRQGERIIYDDIEYKVTSIGIYCYLDNPLTGGNIRLPLRDLIEMRSRPYNEEKEPWFPCKVGDMIDLSGTWWIVREICPQYSRLENFSYNYDHIVPNSMLTKSEVAIISSHPGYTILTNIRLSIQNSAEKIRLGLKLIRQIIENHPGARFIWAKHDHFDDYSFVLRIHYDIYKFKERAIVETDVNTEIVAKFQENDIKFTQIPLLPPETT